VGAVTAPGGGPPRVAWVLYDGACGVCSRWVPFWKGTLERRGIGIAALQEPWVAGRLAARGIHPENFLDDFRIVVEETGDVIPGADAYRWALRRIWWAWPFWALSVTPGLGGFFDAAYRRFAESRYRVSKACRIPVRPPDPGAGL
jgi:predicted DCC family thiol-disulfide oxidoreductase YuxK